MSGSQTELLDTLLKPGYVSPDSLKALKALGETPPFTHGVQNAVLSDGPLEERLGRLVEENLYPTLHAVKDLLQRGLVTFDDALPFFR